MKRILNIITVVITIFATSCIKGDYIQKANNDFKLNYDTFWTLVNENYCFLGDNYGYTKNVDWQKVHDEMMPQVEAAESEVDYLKDGHVWLDTKFNHRGCYTFYYDEFGVKYPDNFIPGLVAQKYLDYPFRSRHGFRYGTITSGDKKFFYLHHDDFTMELTSEDLDMFRPLIAESDGFIYDIRTNPGGSAQLALDIAGRFVKEKTQVGYEVVRSGKGYNDLSEPKALYIVPVTKGDNWADIKTTVLTNRDVYSTANMFAAYMKQVPNATLIGGITGGGGGQPCTYYLPNGWAVTMSAQRMSLDINKVHIERGIEPDFYVTITEEDINNNVDSILEKAIEELSK